MRRRATDRRPTAARRWARSPTLAPSSARAIAGCTPTGDCCGADGRTCSFGCGGDKKCFADCNPTYNGCCTAQGTLGGGVWGDETTGLCWQVTPIDGSDRLRYASSVNPEWDAGTAYAKCRDLDLGGHSDWRVPTIDELRSLIRGRPSTYYNPLLGEGGSCRVTEACKVGCDDAECGYNNVTKGCYWETAHLQGLCDAPIDSGAQYVVGYWSSTFAGPCDWSNPTFCRNWALEFERGHLFEAIWADTTAVNHRHRVRCVRK